MRRTAVDIVEYIEDGHARLGASLVLVNVQRHLLDGLQGLLQSPVVRIAATRVLQDVIQQQTDAGQSLDGSDHQILQTLAAALRLRLVDLEEGVEARIFPIAVLQLLLHLLEEIHVRRIGLDQFVAMLDNDVADEAVLPPIGMQLAQVLQHALMHLMDGQKVAKDGLDLGLVEQRIIGLGQFLQFVFKELIKEGSERLKSQRESLAYIQYGIQNAHIVGLGGEKVHKVVEAHRFLGWRGGITGLWLGMQQFIGRLQLIRTGGAIEEAIRHGQQARVRDGGAPLTRGAQRSALQLDALRETLAFPLVKANG